MLRDLVKNFIVLSLMMIISTNLWPLCDPYQKRMRTMYDQADIVLGVRVKTKTYDICDDDDHKPHEETIVWHGVDDENCEDRISMESEVLEVFKGSWGERVVLKTSNGSSRADLDVGKSYLVFGWVQDNDKGSNSLWISGCEEDTDAPFNYPLGKSVAEEMSKIRADVAEKRPANIRIDIRERLTGRPLQGMRLVMAGENFSAEAVTDREGQFTMDVPQGAYCIAPQADGYSFVTEVFEETSVECHVGWGGAFDQVFIGTKEK